MRIIKHQNTFASLVSFCLAVVSVICGLAFSQQALAVPAPNQGSTTGNPTKSEIQASARNYCKIKSNTTTSKPTSSPTAACRAGYEGAYHDPAISQAKACKSYAKPAGDQLICWNAYDEASKLSPNNPLSSSEQASSITYKPDPALKGCSNTDCDFIGKYINPAINLLSVAFGVIAAASIIMGAIQYSTSGGESAQVSKAKDRIAKTIFAILAYLFLYAFLQFLIPGGIFNR